ncbi:hypothetical protein L228DRAFT_249610 [Xylona heveae TC161]|uniref:Integral membrane protein, Mpv17/PMP22 family n=1 Tax=Xylona heveae (strain CBS 132557 / TC161) TaxID=1328760 RepID=A0A165FBP7_XYLHT|nr:hypothetical protein L228DRAFT_249610 [Xylona heveae TC161]KZF20793.1 hypothetical protein L228DRAFT_249610 [Xylona heveae TC161]
MASPVVVATIQAAILSATSNVLAQAITSYRNDAPFTLDVNALLPFVIFTIISTPPNFLWLGYLEQKLPSTTPAATETAKGKEKEGKEVQSRLNLGNALKKLLIDQIIAGTLNNIAFIAFLAAAKGATTPEVIEAVRQGFPPLFLASLKLWPMVSLISFTVVPADKRVLFLSSIGLGWGVFLSIYNA